MEIVSWVGADAAFFAEAEGEPLEPEDLKEAEGMDDFFMGELS